jgi:hypothetical protein
MDYSKNYFGKSITELKWEDITSFFQESQPETNNIEFKSFGEQLDKGFDIIYKEVTSFLNSDGGLIIWGAPQEKRSEKKKEKISQGELCPTKSVLEKDRIIQKIISNISPMPQGISVNPLDDGNGNYICVIEIKKSQQAHQYNGTYYIRIDATTKPAPHYIVESLIKQIRYPHIEGYLSFLPIVEPNIEYTAPSYELRGSIYIFNWSPIHNEANIKWKLTTDFGRFNQGGMPKGNVITNRHEELHYGNPIQFPFTIQYSKADFENSTSIISLILYFAGKNAPPKQSEYLINVYNRGYPRIDERKENILLADKELNKEEVLKQWLGDR